MNTLLYIIFIAGVLIFVYLYFLEKRSDSSIAKPKSDAFLPDLAQALRDERTRKEFARRSSITARTAKKESIAKQEQDRKVEPQKQQQGLKVKIISKKRREITIEKPQQEQADLQQEIKKTLSENALPKNTHQPVKHIGQPIQQATSRVMHPIQNTVTSSQQIVQAGLAGETHLEIHENIPSVSIKRILAPVVVEQGQHNQSISLVVQNISKIGVDLIASRLHFRREDKDVSLEYTVRAKVGNAIRIEAGECEEIRLTVDVTDTASLGKITLVPSVVAGWENQEPCSIQLATSKLCQWRVEPMGRKFKIYSEHYQSEIAGNPFSLTLETFLGDKIDSTYHGPRRIFFSLSNVSSNSSAQLPRNGYIDLVFEHGRAATEQEFCFFNTVDSYVIKARDNKPGGGTGKSGTIELSPCALGGFRLEIYSPQKNQAELEGENTLTALDLYNNVKIDYQSDVLLSCTEGSIKGMPGVGSLIAGTSFRNGLVNLTLLKLKLSLSGLKNEGKMVKLIAKAHRKIAHSNEVMVLPSTAASMPPSATQAMVRRLWGYRKKRIWIANTDPEIAKSLYQSFQQDYEVVSQEIELEHLDRLTSNPPEILFLGTEKSGSKGYQILSEIRKTPHMECLPIFVIGSSKEQESRISEVLRSGAIYLTKPLSLPAVRAMIADLLQNISIEQGHMPGRGARIQGSEGLVYQIVAKIGEGGMGYIYEAKRLRDLKKVIVKYLPPRDFRNLKSVVRFIQEAHAVLKFQHTNLVSGFDMLMDRNRCFYVMEFIEGHTIEQLIRIEKKIKPDRALRLVLQITRALQHLEEEHNLVHRDIKPSNILVTEQGLVKLVDFGIAKLGNHHLTTVGIILGTPYYLSPEQILGKEVTIQSDIYSLGATFYHMVTGEHPFQGPDVYTIIHQRLSRDPRDPRQYSQGLPRSVAKILMRMMDRKLNRRYINCRTLIEDIENVLQCMESGTLKLEANLPL